MGWASHDLRAYPGISPERLAALRALMLAVAAAVEGHGEACACALCPAVRALLRAP